MQRKIFAILVSCLVFALGIFLYFDNKEPRYNVTKRIVLMSANSQQVENKKTEPIARRVILIGLDGLSVEAFKKVDTPNVRRLMKNGSTSFTARAVMPTVSTSNWASILTSVGPEQHGITSSEWIKNSADILPTIQDENGYFPSIFWLMRNQKPNCVMGMFYTWDGLEDFINLKYLNKSVCAMSFVDSFTRATRYIVNEKPDFTFVYAGEPDHIGHEFGWGSPEYYEMIKKLDVEIGKMLDALVEAKMYDETYFILVSDHGGVGKNHGGSTMMEIEVPWILSGPEAFKNKTLDFPFNSLDTASTIAFLFGLDIPREWTGRPVVEALDYEAKRPVNQ